MSAQSWGREPEPPAGEGELRGPGRVQTARVGGGAAVLGVTGKRRAFPGRLEGGRPPEGIGLRATPRSWAVSPASRRAIWGPWSRRRSWDLVDRVSRPVSEVGMVLQIKISVTRLHLLSREENNQRCSVFCRVTQHFSVLCLLVLHQVVGFSFYKPSNSPKISQLIKVRAGTLLY